MCRTPTTDRKDSVLIRVRAALRKWNLQPAWRSVLFAGPLGGAAVAVFVSVFIYLPLTANDTFSQSVGILLPYVAAVALLSGFIAGAAASTGGSLLRLLTLRSARVVRAATTGIGAAVGTIPISLALAWFLIIPPLVPVVVVSLAAGVSLAIVDYANRHADVVMDLDQADRT